MRKKKIVPKIKKVAAKKRKAAKGKKLRIKPIRKAAKIAMPEIEESPRKELSEKELFEMLSPKRGMDLKIQKIFEELPEKFSIILLERLSEYGIINARIVKYLVKKNMKGVYVTVNKNLSDLVNTFEREEILMKNIIFIDAITRVAGDIEVKGENFRYVDSPRDVIDINVALESAANHLGEGKKFIIIDSLTTLLVYNKERTVERFVHAVSGKMRIWEAQGIFVLMESTKEGIKNTLAQFCDRVVII